EIKRTHEWDPKAPRFISVRHLRELYNIPCILRAFRQVQQQIPEASLTILGRGPQLEELQQYVRDNNLKHVNFAGQVPNEEMNRYLAEHDIFLSAPRVDNMPVSVLEAMNAGVLVISSKVGGVPYIIEDVRT
ncbi:MAG: glycosyltransferase family 4 protein, partial [Paludibacteraceae bacterium]|nr:glycosyltransferase family 4 protein [Paludibacteraceae bacterium]